MDPLFIGEKCTLKSGGPLMIVSNFRDDRVTCDWFDDEKVVHSYVFPRACLNRILDRDGTYENRDAI